VARELSNQYALSQSAGTKWAQKTAVLAQVRPWIQADATRHFYRQRVGDSVKLKVLPVHFEAYDEDISDAAVFTVKCFDEVCSEVKIEWPVDVAAWDAIAPEIRKCLVAIHGEKTNDEG
jgi:hypothetical protein